MKLARKEDIVKYISILDLAKEFQIRTEAISSGNFDYRCRCPSPEHKGGMERTESLYIDSINNNFHCFGCSQGQSCIDFYMICSGKTFQESIQELRSRVDPDKITIGKLDIKKSNFNILLQISKLFKTQIRRHPEDIIWTELLMKKTDYYIAKINPEDLNRTQNLYHKIDNIISKRYGKK